MLQLGAVDQDVGPATTGVVSSRVIRSSSSSSVAPARSIFAAARLLAARRDNNSFPRMEQVTPRPRAPRASSRCRPAAGVQRDAGPLPRAGPGSARR